MGYKRNSKGDIWKNMFDKVCDYLIKDRIQAGEKIPTNISELQKVRKYISKKLTPPYHLDNLVMLAIELVHFMKDYTK